MSRIEPTLVPLVTDLERGLRELGIPFGIIGALVPELLLDARPARMTNDVDATIVVQSLADFDTLKDRLGRFGFTRVRWAHRLQHRSGGLVDLLPFSESIAPDGRLRLDEGFVLNMAGFGQVVPNVLQTAIEGVIIYLTGELSTCRLVFMGMDTPRTLLEAVTFFAVPDNCREYLVSRRWPNGVTCPRCGSSAVYFDKGRNGWECKTRHPQRKFTLKTGTIFEDSPLGFDKWLPAAWMIANCKNGVSSWELSRAVGVTQKTAWFMLQRIRLAMQDSESGGKLGGEVEVDETFIGGKARNMSPARKKRKGISQHTSMASKAAVMGLLERHPQKGKSRIRLQTLDNRKRTALLNEVRTHVDAGATIHTDALGSYVGLAAEGFVHNVIDHAEAYVNGNVHTNGCENFWSLLKRALKGTYVAVEPFHLFRYLDEQAFRFNNRTATDSERFSDVVSSVVGRRLTYKELIAAADATAPA